MSKVVFAIASAAVVMLIALFTGILPESPFLAYMNWSEMNEFMGFINFFIPIDQIIVISEAWLLCLGPWIIAQLIIKAIKILGEYIPFT